MAASQQSSPIGTLADPSRIHRFFEHLKASGTASFLPLAANELIVYLALAAVTEGLKLQDEFREHAARLIPALEKLVAALEAATHEAHEAQRYVLTRELGYDLVRYRERLEKARQHCSADRFGRGENWLPWLVLETYLSRILRRRPNAQELHDVAEAARHAAGLPSKNDCYEFPGDLIIRGIRRFEKRNTLDAERIKNLPLESFSPANK